MLQLYSYCAFMCLFMQDVTAALIKRPSLLGLDVNENLRKIVDYLKYTETPPETIVKYIVESI